MTAPGDFVVCIKEHKDWHKCGACMLEGHPVSRRIYTVEVMDITLTGPGYALEECPPKWCRCVSKWVLWDIYCFRPVTKPSIENLRWIADKLPLNLEERDDQGPNPKPRRRIKAPEDRGEA